MIFLYILYMNKDILFKSSIILFGYIISDLISGDKENDKNKLDKLLGI